MTNRSTAVHMTGGTDVWRGQPPEGWCCRGDFSHCVNYKFKDGRCDLAKALRCGRAEGGRGGKSGCWLRFPLLPLSLVSLHSGRSPPCVAMPDALPSWKRCDPLASAGWTGSLFPSLPSLPLPCSGKGSRRECGQVAPEIYI